MKRVFGVYFMLLRVKIHYFCIVFLLFAEERRIAIMRNPYLKLRKIFSYAGIYTCKMSKLPSVLQRMLRNCENFENGKHLLFT